MLNSLISQKPIECNFFQYQSLFKKLANIKKQSLFSINKELDRRIEILKTEKYLIILDTLKIISQAISSCTFEKAHMDKVAEILHELFNIDEFYYAVIREKSLQKIVSYVNPRSIKIFQPRKIVTSKEIPEFWDSLQNGNCYCVEDGTFFEEEEKYYGDLKIKNVYACPVIVDGKIRGVIGFNRLDKSKWTAEEKSICKIFSSLTATSLWMRDTKQCTK